MDDLWMDQHLPLVIGVLCCIVAVLLSIKDAE